MFQHATPSVSHPPLTDDCSCDAAVIGGGITGVLCAHALALRGLSVVLLEERTIAHTGSRTARSTAKATVAHGTVYSALSETVSPEAARKYAAANLAGLRFLRSIAASVEAAESKAMYLYALHGERRLRREFCAMRDCGIPCHFTADASLPFPAAAAIVLPDQLALNPVVLTESLCAMGHFRVYEHSPVTAVGRHSLRCLGHTVTARHILAATNYPYLREGGMPMKLFRQSSYAVAVRCQNGFRMPDILAFGADGGYGYRYADTPGGRALVVSGESHRGAASPNTFERLLRAARDAAYGEIEILRQWSNNDGYTHDGIPCVGALPGGLLVACGYGAWGMTNAAAAAVMLAEQVCGSGIWYDDLFSPARNFLHGGVPRFTEHLRVTCGGMLRTLAAPPDRYAGDIACGQAAIINYHGSRAGAYRSADGHLHIVTLRCPHRGCSLEWNPACLTWDCPCHGSRFSYSGLCLSNPAIRGIALL